MQPNSAHRILIVDDDVELCELLQRYLTQNSYHVATVGDAKEMDSYLANNSVDLIILDLMLPGEDGLSIAKRLRTSTDTPIIMASARGEEIDRIIGLEMGADDYMPKPFNPRELLARIRAQLRRQNPTLVTEPISHSNEPQSVISVGHFTIDLVHQQLTLDGASHSLTTAEFLLMRVFMENPQQQLSRDQLVQKLKGYERQPYDRSVDVRVTRLRKKLEQDPSNPIFIRTIWGKGYIFTPQGLLP